MECSPLQHPNKVSFNSISSSGNDLDALKDLSADELEAVLALEVLKSASTAAAASHDTPSSTLSSSLLGPDSTPRKRLLLAASFANRAATSIGSGGQAATNSPAQPPSSSTMGLQHPAAAAAASQRLSSHRQTSSTRLKLERSDCPARSSSAPGKGWLQDEATAAALARSAAAPRWGFFKAGTAPAVQQAAAAEDGWQDDDTKAPNSRRSSKKGAKQKQQQAQQDKRASTAVKEAKDREAKLGKIVGEQVHKAVPEIYQLISELKAGKGAPLSFPCSDEVDGAGSTGSSSNQHILSSKEALEEGLGKLPQYLQKSLRSAANELLDDPSPGGPMRWGKALGHAMARNIKKKLSKDKTAEDAKLERLQLASLCCSTLERLKPQQVTLTVS